MFIQYADISNKVFLDSIKKQNNGKIPIEQIWNIETDNQIWYDIPGFIGYQISNTMFVRSFKYKKVK